MKYVKKKCIILLYHSLRIREDFLVKEKIIGCLILFIIGAGIVTGAYYAGMAFGKKHSKYIMPSKIEQKALKERETVTVFVPADEEGEINVAPKKYRINKEIEKDILNESMNILIKDLVSQKILPNGTELASNVKVDGNIAVIDFNKEIKNFSGGSNEESQLMNSLAYTAIKNGKDIKYIQILMNGEKMETLGGHFELNDPYAPEKNPKEQ